MRARRRSRSACSSTRVRRTAWANVDKGTTETDFDEEEQQRGITIYSACVTFPWRDAVINLIDTPGHVDFTAEVERSLRVLDGGVVVFSAREGVEAQSETVWRQADRYHVPRIAFINKMDREGADFEGTLSEIESRLKANPVAIHVPIGHGPPHTADAFRGIIDLVAMKQLTFSRETEGRDILVEDISPEFRERAEMWREVMLEKLYGYSDELTLLALEEKPIPQELLRKVLRDATLHLQVQPVLCGSALDGIGVQPVLDAVAWYLPSPADLPPVKGQAPRESKKSKREDDGMVEAQRRASEGDPFCGLVFKVLPAKTGDMSYVRIYSGKLEANSRVLNPGKNEKENIAQLWHIQAARRQQVTEATAGDIVGVIGLRHSITGDTLCDPRHPILLESIVFPETVITMAVEPNNAAERKKMAEVLEMMKLQDPTFRAQEDPETGQTVISGMGELHLEVIKHRMLRDFKLDVKFHQPRVSYRETVQHAAQVSGECHRMVAGQQLFALVKLALEPASEETGVKVTSRCPPESLPYELVDAVLTELKSLGESGGEIGGFPLSQLKVTFLGGETREEGSTDMAFRIAAAEAFHKGLSAGGPQLLEPVMKLDITTPEEFLGDFVGDLQKRRAEIARTDIRGDLAVVEARAPLAELFGYSGAMRSLSQGRASCSMEPLKYAAAPAEVSQRFAM